MQESWKWIVVILTLSAVLAGCGSVAQPQTTSADLVTISLKTNPASPTAGQNELIFILEDQKGQPVTGANLKVSADHTNMSGMTMSGPATEQGNGQYAITTDFSMSGNWKITVTVRKEDLEIKKDFALQIP